MLSLKSTQFLDVASLAKSVKIVYFGLFFMQIFRPSYLWKKFTDPGFFPAKKMLSNQIFRCYCPRFQSFSSTHA